MGGRMLRVWQGYRAMALECTFYHPDDEGATSFEVSLPLWPWRVVCWLRGHADDTYGNCCVCRKVLR